MIKRPLQIIILLCFFSCDKIESFLGKNDTPENSNIVKNYYENGKLKSYYTINDLRQKHGVAKSFNQKGVLTKSFEYVNGEKVKAMTHYENGNPLLEINYKNEIKDGLLKRYYESGQVESEIEYKENFPGMGLKEYTKSGQLKKNYPNLIVKGHDRLDVNGKYIIEVYFDKNPGRGTYYLGELAEGKYLSYRLEKLERSNYRGQFILKPPPGAVIMEKLSFVGEFKTPTGNKYIVQKYFNLAVDNTY